MTVADFVRNCVDYFGDWKGWSIRKPLEAWLAKRGETYMDVLWPLVRDSRSVNYGPPDMRCVTDLHIEVCDRLDVLRAERAKTSLPPLFVPESARVTEPITAEAIAKWPRIEDDTGDRWLSREETSKALGIIFGKLEASKKAEAPKPEDYTDPYHPRDEPLFPKLSGVRWNAPVQLSPEFYDETMSMEDRMRSYAARYRGKRLPGANP